MKPGLALVLLVLLVPVVPADEQDWTVRLALTPATAPSPALRYPLLPDLRDTSPGNAALLYYRAFSPEWLTHRRPEVAKILDAWRADTSKKPSAELRWVLTHNALKEVDCAARRAYCDWEMTERVRKDGISTLLPDIQGMRDFASLLALRARFHMESGEHEKVLHTIQTGLALGRHIADGPTLIQSLVGIAVSTIMLNEVQRWLERPGSPNLYWSLSQLPAPFVDLRKPLQGERLILDSLFPGLREAMKSRKPNAFSTDQLQTVLRDLSLLPGLSQSSEQGLTLLGSKLGVAMYAVRVYPEAKTRLREQGWTAKEIDALPVTTAALMHEVLEYDRIYDDLVKWYPLPYPQARQGITRTLAALKPSEQGAPLGGVLARLLAPSVDKVFQAGLRLDRRIALLRTVEALRLHAAAHDGKWPERLAYVSEVPVPLDPVTGKPFAYERDGDRVILHGPPPAGEKPHFGNSVKYEITLKK